MNYKKITIESFDTQQEHIMLTRDDGSFESFPVDENNSRYQQFLAETAEEKPKAKNKSKDK